LKEKLHNVKDKMNNFCTVEMTKVVTISMDVLEKPHILKLYLNEREPYHRIIYAHLARNELYKSGLTKFLATVLRENDCFIDIGTHIGYFSLLGATLVGYHGQVFSFEPEEKNYRYLYNAHSAPLWNLLILF
jgi:hypothetical protein